MLPVGARLAQKAEAFLRYADVAGKLIGSGWALTITDDEWSLL